MLLCGEDCELHFQQSDQHRGIKRATDTYDRLERIIDSGQRGQVTRKVGPSESIVRRQICAPCVRHNSFCYPCHCVPIPRSIAFQAQAEWRRLAVCVLLVVEDGAAAATCCSAD